MNHHYVPQGSLPFMIKVNSTTPWGKAPTQALGTGAQNHQALHWDTAYCGGHASLTEAPRQEQVVASLSNLKDRQYFSCTALGKLTGWVPLTISERTRTNWDVRSIPLLSHMRVWASQGHLPQPICHVWRDVLRSAGCHGNLITSEMPGWGTSFLFNTRVCNPISQRGKWHIWGMWAAGGMGPNQGEKQLSRSGSKQDMNFKKIYLGRTSMNFNFLCRIASKAKRAAYDQCLRAYLQTKPRLSAFPFILQKLLQL